MPNYYKTFDPADIISSVTKTKTYPIWSDSPTDADVNLESILRTFYSSSLEIANWEGNYYWNVFSESPVTNLNAPTQFSVSVGTTASVLLNHADEEYQYTYPSNAVYKQYRNILEYGENGSWFTNADGSTINTAYFVHISKDRLKGFVEQDTWQMNLSGSIGASGSLLNLIDSGSNVTGRRAIPIVTGRLSNYTGPTATSADGIPMGLFYPDHGVFVLDAVKIHTYIGSGSAGFSPTIASPYTPSLALSNVFNLINRGVYFQARTTQEIKSSYYFCKMGHSEFNYSTNPTWLTGSYHAISPNFRENQKSFITAIGLYDSGSLVAIAKLSRPIPKDNTTEHLIRVSLDF